MKENDTKKERLADQMARLEKIVAQLEDEDMDIEEAMAAFEEGVKLSQRCLAKLEEISKRVEKLISAPDGVRRQPLDQSDK